jgi:hypothetical protein
MPETVKKTKAPAKPRKAAAKKSANNLETMPSPQQRHVSEDEVAQLAHRYWHERGRVDGHHEEDWYRAEQELRGKAS